jgi:hypothetical protein
MAFSITLYQFDKLHNSTKIPVVSAGTLATTCEIKTVCSAFVPVVTFTDTTFTSNDQLYAPTRYNYAYISDFSRYYWITNWSWNNGIWAASLQVDVLASFKTDIGSSSQYVLRSASRYNSDIADSKYITFYKSGRNSSSSNTISSPWKVSLNSADCNNGFFVVGIVNRDRAAIGATSYYYFAPKSLRYFLGIMMDAPTWLNITDVTLTADLQKIMFNPMQYIVSCMYIPYALPAAFADQANQVLDIDVGWWNIDVSGAPAMSIFRAVSTLATASFGMDITIPRNPQAATRPYAKLSPYSEYTLEFWPFGLIALDSTKIYASDNLHVSVELDFITGRGILRLNNGTAQSFVGAPFYETVAQVGIPVSVAQITLDRSTLTSGGTWLMAAGMSILHNHGDAINDIINYEPTVANPMDTQAMLEATKSPLDKWYEEQTESGGGGGSSSFGWGWSTETQAVANAAQDLGTTIMRDVSDILSSVVASAGSCNYSGQTGGFVQYTDNVKLILHYCDLADEDVARYGRPLCEVCQIDTLSGYILCATGDVKSNAIKAERELISAFLTGGFYYE